jgi:hypothetical protein
MSFAALAPALLVGGGVLQTVGAIQEGNAKKSEALARQQELNREAELSTIAGNEQQASRLRELNTNIGQIRALVGQRGLSIASPSSIAIQSSVDRQATRDTRNIAFNASQSASNLRVAGLAARQSGNAAQMAGYIRGASSLFKAAADSRSLFQS